MKSNLGSLKDVFHFMVCEFMSSLRTLCLALDSKDFLLCFFLKVL